MIKMSILNTVIIKTDKKVRDNCTELKACDALYFYLLHRYARILLNNVGLGIDFFHNLRYNYTVILFLYLRRSTNVSFCKGNA